MGVKGLTHFDMATIGDYPLNNKNNLFCVEKVCCYAAAAAAA